MFLHLRFLRFSHRNLFIHNPCSRAHHTVFHDFLHIRHIFDWYRSPHMFHSPCNILMKAHGFVSGSPCMDALHLVILLGTSPPLCVCDWFRCSATCSPQSTQGKVFLSFFWSVIKNDQQSLHFMQIVGRHKVKKNTKKSYHNLWLFHTGLFPQPIAPLRIIFGINMNIVKRTFRTQSTASIVK